MSVDIAKAFSAYARSRSNITDLIGTRLYADRLKQGAELPALVYWVVTERSHEALDGAIGLDQARIQVDAYGESRWAATNLAWNVWNEFNNYTGVSSQVYIKGVSRVSGVRYFSDRVKAGSDVYRFGASQDLLLSYDSLNLVT